MKFLEDLAARQRFGMKPGLETIRALCEALGDPQKRFRAIHVAGTNGKGAVCALIDAALRAGTKEKIGRYTSPHLVRLNERFFLNGSPVDDTTLDRISEKVNDTILHLHLPSTPTFFEALTAAAFELYAEAGVERVVLECGLGGRLDATNICVPELCVITRIGLDHCDWLGETVEKIATEKAGIIKSGVPIVLGENQPSVRAIIEARAHEQGAPFFYAPDLATEGEIPSDFPLVGRFNRENAVTAIAALKVLGSPPVFSSVVWPGRFHRIGSFLVDGAHNPPAAHALASSLSEILPKGEKLDLIFGACGDKDVGKVLNILKPFVRKAYAVRTNNPRSLTSEDLADKMRTVGMEAMPCASLSIALTQKLPNLLTSQPPNSPTSQPPNLPTSQPPNLSTLICGSLFLVGEALVALGACPWSSDRFDPSERLI